MGGGGVNPSAGEEHLKRVPRERMGSEWLTSDVADSRNGQGFGLDRRGRKETPTWIQNWNAN